MLLKCSKMLPTGLLARAYHNHVTAVAMIYNVTATAMIFNGTAAFPS